ncbi:MAG: terminase [Acidobacteria bacterium]|nr:MAG: terminase [Acidobacteriota bacterium]
MDLEALMAFGKRLDKRVGSWSYREVLAESLLRIRNKQGRLVKLMANPAQKEFELKCGQKNIVLKARQMGISTWVAARFFLSTITRPGTLTVQVAHTQEAAEEIFRLVHRFVENLPRDLKHGALRRSRSNRRQLVFPALDSEYRVETAGDANAGRGLTIQNLHCSEVARWGANAADVLASLRAAVPPEGEVVLESTPNGMGGCFYREWQRANETGYVQHFFPWWMDAGYRIKNDGDLAVLSDDERRLMKTFGLDAEQIAFRRQIKNNFGERAAEEFAEDPTTCFRASGSAVFDTAKIEARLQALEAPLESRENGRILIWLPPAKGRAYLMGVDAAGGGAGGDYACVQVIDQASGLQCAELYGHYTPEELAAQAARLGREYNDALMVVERNNHGHAVLAMLEQVEQYEPLYRDRRFAGWVTTVLTRPTMLERFGAMLVTNPELFQSRRLLEECRTFVRREDGRSAAAEGSHDDAIMAMAMALAVRDGVCLE